MIPMAEGFEQQSRRDHKLRVNNNPLFRIDNAPILPLHDPPFISSDLIHQSNFNLDGMHMIAPSNSLSPTNHMYLNSVQTNPNDGQNLCLTLSSHNLEMNLQRYGCVVKRSRFLKPMQVLLEEICDLVKGICFGKGNEIDLSVMDSYPSENLSGHESEKLSRKKSRLIAMLDEVHKRYKQYFQQIQAVVASFESISGLSSAAPLANMALKTLSKHFRCLKNAISDQLQFNIKSKDVETYYKLESSGSGAYGQTGYNDHRPVWRPQRGLPERAVTVLRAWLFEHFLHPYPTDTDKLMLARQTGLSRNQVSNWFINARVRLWKPMVEEIHMLESHQGQKNPQSEEQQNDHFPTTSSYDEFPSTRNYENVTQTPLPYDNILHNPHEQLDVGASNASGVSLTLGLHQNSIAISESYPINAARRFGLETEQNGQFGRDIIGQLSQDFVW